MKKTILWLMVVVLSISIISVFSLTGCKEETAEEETVEETDEETAEEETVEETDEQVVIGMTLRDTTTETFITQNNAMLEVVDKYGWKMIIEDAQMDLSKQISQIENFMMMGVDYIYINVFDPAIEDTVKKAVDAGFFVIVHDATFPEASFRFGRVDNYKYGYNIGKIAADYINSTEVLKDAEVVEWGLQTYTIAVDIIDRSDGTKAAMEELAPNAKLVAEQNALSLEEAVSLTEDWVQAYPDMKCVLGATDSFVYGSDQVFKAAGWVDEEYILAACDGTQAAFELIADESSPYRGTVALTLEDTSRELIEELYKHHNGEEIPRDLYWGMEIVTIDNVSDWIK